MASRIAPLVLAAVLLLTGGCDWSLNDAGTRTRPAPPPDEGAVVKRVPTRTANQYHTAEVNVIVRRDNGSTFSVSLNNPKLCMLGTKYPACDA